MDLRQARAAPSGGTRRPAAARRVVRPTLRGGVLLVGGGVLLSAAWAADERDLLFVAGVAVLVPLLSLGYVLLQPLRVSVARGFRPETVPAGLSATVTISIHNLGSTTLVGLRWRDRAVSGITVPARQALRPLAPAPHGRLTPRDTARLDYQVRPLKRGVYSIGPVMIGRADPFGLAVSEWPLGDAHDLIVTPTVTALPGNGVSVTSGEGTLHERVRHLDNDSDELIAREYRPGDPMRRVNWPATARHGEIMVRQEEQRSHPAARVVLDTTCGRAGPGNDAEFERAVELTASISVHLINAGFRLDVVELGSSQLAPGIARSGNSRLPRDPDEGQRGGLRGDDPASFAGSEGALALIGSLAQITAHGRVPDEGAAEPGHLAHHAASSSARQIPTFAVLVDIAAPDTTDLVAFRGFCQPAVAFVFDTMSADALERLGDAGWQCVPVDASTGIAAAWERAGRDRVAQQGDGPA